MRFEGVCIPVSGSWSSPFVRWQGPAAEISSLDLALQVTGDALARSGVDWPISELVLGITVPQKEAFYGAPTLANRLGLGDISGPMLAQACATSVACVHWAAANQQGAATVRASSSRPTARATGRISSIRPQPPRARPRPPRTGCSTTSGATP